MRGFSLVELMVTITIMMLMIAIGAPFASGWGNSAAVQQSKGQTLRAMAQLKALALRNPNSIASADPSDAAAVLVSTGTQICVYAGKPASLACNAGASWSAILPAPLTLNGAGSQCIAVNSAAVPVVVTIGTTVCGTAMSYAINRGGESVGGTLI